MLWIYIYIYPHTHWPLTSWVLHVLKNLAAQQLKIAGQEGQALGLQLPNHAERQIKPPSFSKRVACFLDSERDPCFFPLTFIGVESMTEVTQIIE